MSNQDRKVKCPHCGWIRSVPVKSLVDASMTDAVMGMGDAIKAVGAKIRAMLSDRELQAANAWIDMPACPNCKNTYGYNVLTGEVRE